MVQEYKKCYNFVLKKIKILLLSLNGLKLLIPHCKNNFKLKKIK